jgi:hypothetical protein
MQPFRICLIGRLQFAFGGKDFALKMAAKRAQIAAQL